MALEIVVVAAGFAAAVAHFAEGGSGEPQGVRVGRAIVFGGSMK